MGETEFLNSLECLKNDYGSYAPIMKDHLDSDQMKKITNKLAQRIVEVDDENGLSTTFSIESLTSKQEALASTFVGKSDVLCDQSITMNSLTCGEDVESSNEGIEVIATTQCDEGVELIPAAVGVVLNESKADAPPLSNESSPLQEPKKYGQYDPFGVKTDYSSGFIHEAPQLKRVRHFSFSNVDNLDKYEDIDLSKRKTLSNLMEAQASGVNIY